MAGSHHIELNTTMNELEEIHAWFIFCDGRGLINVWNEKIRIYTMTMAMYGGYQIVNIVVNTTVVWSRTYSRSFLADLTSWSHPLKPVKP